MTEWIARDRYSRYDTTTAIGEQVESWWRSEHHRFIFILNTTRSEEEWYDIQNISSKDMRIKAYLISRRAFIEEGAIGLEIKKR